MTLALSYVTLASAQASLALDLAHVGGAQHVPWQALVAGNGIGGLRGMLLGLAPPARNVLTRIELRCIWGENESFAHFSTVVPPHVQTC